MHILDEKILQCFKEIAKRLVNLNKEILSKINIKQSYYKVLSVLSVNNNINQTTLGDICAIDKPATSRLVNSMQKENLVAKSLQDNNKKSIYITLTEKGKNLICKINKSLNEIKNKYFNILQNDDKQTFLNLLNKTLKKETADA